MTIFRSLENQPKSALMIAGLVLVILLGVVDYLTGPQISFSVFYLLPISLVTWFTGRNGGIGAAVISALTWLAADLASASSYTHPLIPFWNAVVRLLVFLAIVFLGSALKELNEDLEKRVKERTALLEEEVAERKKVESRLQQYAKRLEILHEIDQAILAAESLEAVAHTTVGHVRDILGCHKVSFLLLDFDARQVLLFEAQEDIKEKAVPMETIPDLNAILDLLRKNALHSEKELAGSALHGSIARILNARDYLSLAILPIVAQYELIGSLNLMSHGADAFSTEHREIGREIANQLGIAINQARMVGQLRNDQENLQALSQRLLNVQETERRHIARELHDEIGQALTGIGLTLEMAIAGKARVKEGNFKQAHALVVELMERVSQLSLELRPALLDDLGLLPAVLWHLDRYTAQTKIKINLKHSGLDDRRFGSEVETAAYRIIQEGLTNVARHARVGEARLTIWHDQNVLGIQVEDEGRGFDGDPVHKEKHSGGLLGMQERALLLNGKLTIESAPGAGTRLLAELPLLGEGNER